MKKMAKQAIKNAQSAETQVEVQEVQTAQPTAINVDGVDVVESVAVQTPEIIIDFAAESASYPQLIAAGKIFADAVNALDTIIKGVETAKKAIGVIGETINVDITAVEALRAKHAPQVLAYKKALSGQNAMVKDVHVYTALENDRLKKLFRTVREKLASKWTASQDVPKSLADKTLHPFGLMDVVYETFRYQHDAEGKLSKVCSIATSTQKEMYVSILRVDLGYMDRFSIDKDGVVKSMALSTIPSGKMKGQMVQVLPPSPRHINDLINIIEA